MTTTPPNVHISDHPILSHKISILRSSSTIPSAFRSVLRELTFHLGYEATSKLTTKSVALTVPVGKDHVDHTGQTLAEKVALVPILRSGLGMVDSMLELVPNAAVHHIGMYRREMMPVQYYNRLPKKCEADVVFILDPIIATSNTVMSVISILKKVRVYVEECWE
jgi:uracil phosphoribosyltransferase